MRIKLVVYWVCAVEDLTLARREGKPVIYGEFCSEKQAQKFSHWLVTFYNINVSVWESWEGAEGDITPQLERTQKLRHQWCNDD